jgi:DNA-binding LacI/PurR family transcriptional regulator
MRPGDSKTVMSKRQPPPSAHDVARLAGVSQAAVSRAFTPGASIATATRDKVFEAARTLGYRPNLIARSLIKGKSGIVGVVIGNSRYPFFQAVLAAMSERLSRHAKHILIYTAEGSAPADPQVEELLKFRVEAVLLMSATLSAKLTGQCQREGVPLIGFTHPPKVAPWLSAVTGDDLGGGARIAEHLLQQGYRSLAVIAGRPDASASYAREAGFTRYLAEQGLTPPVREFGHFRREGAIEATRTLLSRTSRPDAIFCENDDMALAAIEVARFEFGLVIGRELGVVGFDDVEQASWPSFDLTTYSLPVEAVSERVTALVADAEATFPVTAVVPGELKARGSTRR